MGGTLNLQSWTEAEQRRKKYQLENWRKDLHDELEEQRRRKRDVEEKERIEEMKLEMKIQSDLEQMKSQFEEELAKKQAKANKVASQWTSVQYKQKSRAGSTRKGEGSQTPEWEKPADTYSIYKRNNEYHEEGIMQDL